MPNAQQQVSMLRVSTLKGYIRTVHAPLDRLQDRAHGSRVRSARRVFSNCHLEGHKRESCGRSVHSRRLSLFCMEMLRLTYALGSDCGCESVRRQWTV